MLGEAERVIAGSVHAGTALSQRGGFTPLEHDSALELPFRMEYADKPVVPVIGPPSFADEPVDGLLAIRRFGESPHIAFGNAEIKQAPV